jgi:hypothetical protein
MANPENFPLKILQIFAPFFPQKPFVQLAEELLYLMPKFAILKTHWY